MKSVGLVVLGLSAVVRGSLEVEVCSDSVNLFGIKDVDLGEFVVAGEEVDVKFSQVPNQYIGKGHVKIEMQVEGVNVQTVHHSLCEVTDCHIVPHVESKSSASFKIPEKVASGFKTSLKIVINDHDGKQLSCVTVDGVKVQKKQTLFKSEKHVSVGEHACMSKDELEFLYNKWSIEHGIRFVGDKLIERMKVFADNLENIAKHNMNKEHTYQLGLNEFAHLTQEEFSETHFGYSGGENKPEQRKYFSTISEDMMDTLSNDVPNEIDWTKKGAVTSVKNQGSCGSCWSFSTTGALEGAYFLKTGKLVSFSEQELVSCDKVDQGCNGGLMDNADKWIEKNGGLCSEEDYPYVSGGGAFKQCKEDNCKNVPGSAVKSYVDVEHNEAALEKAIAKTPVAIAIEADQMSFQFYSKGVLTGRCGAQLDHGVLAVGYGTLDGVKYYKVKNSWGPSWGMNGYILLERGKEVKGGECGILLSASYPVL